MGATKIRLGGISQSYPVAGNWVGSSPPVNTDDVIIPKSDGIIDGSDQTATLLDSFTIENGHGQNIGSHGVPLQIDAVSVCLGGKREQFLYFNDATEIFVRECANRGVTTEYGLVLTGAENDYVKIDCSGLVGLGPFKGETAEFAVVNLINGQLFIGRDVITNGADDITTLTASGGSLTNHANIATANITNCAVEWNQGVSDTLITVGNGGVLNLNGEHAITKIVLQGNGRVDLDGGNSASITITDVTIESPTATWVDTFSRAIHTNPISDPNNKYGFGYDRTLAVT